MFQPAAKDLAILSHVVQYQAGALQCVTVVVLESSGISLGD